MATLTFADTYNMVAYLSKSDASAGFDQVVDFLNAQDIEYALMVNPTIYVSCIKQFLATASIKKVNDVVKLRALIDGKRVVVREDVIRQALHLDDADGVEFLPNEEIFTELARMGYEKPPPKLMFYKAFFSAQWKFLIHTFIQCVSAKRTAWNKFSCSMASTVICLATGFSRAETPLFATMLVQPQPPNAEEEYEVKVPNAPTPPSPTSIPSPPPQDPISTPLQAQPATPNATPPHEQPTNTSKSSMTLLNTLMETCATLFQKRRIDDDNAATKDVNAAKPTVFDDEKVTMTMALTLIKMKAEKARLLDEQMDKRLHDEKVEQAAARENRKKMIWKELKCYNSISIAQARKNMIVYLKNMAGYKMEHFKSMTYDKVRPIFEREYKKVQTLFNTDKDEEPTKKRVAEETLLQESFKKLKVVEGSVSEFKVEALQVKYPLIDWEIHYEGLRSYCKIIRVGEITEAYQSFKYMLKGFDREDLNAL
uniref:Synaptobrevin, longin-like domain protein n=1 Tax=Tanacetum cinerariifolium TaxID=118510 RepID=A0A6L2LAT4_TANCI|nr:hypothetical protein [Tanacetum cinerariifolium]